jgi:cytosine/adenosine deaminase-related metal-dependent hydrolase
MGTTGSAQLLGREQTLGSLEVGKAADMFLLDTRQLGFRWRVTTTPPFHC